MTCAQCGGPLHPDDLTCPTCGAPVAHTQSASTATSASATAATGATTPVTGTAHRHVSPEWDAVTTARFTPLAVPDGDADIPADSTGPRLPRIAASAGASLPPPAIPPRNRRGAARDDATYTDGTSKKRLWAIVGAVVALLLVVGVALGVWRASSSSTSSKSAASESAASCNAMPVADVESVKQSGTSLVADLSLRAAGCRDLQYRQSGVQVSLKDADGAVLASAVYDFARAPIAFSDGRASVALAFSARQYWRPVSEMGAADGMRVVWQAGQRGDGAAAGDVDGALGGADVANADRYAQLALQRQVARDRAAAAFNEKWTDQLSSKKVGMVLDGRTWTAADIYEHFLTVRAKHPKALLIWAADYPNYTRYGHESDYYVILSGESFDDEQQAQDWCAANGYGSEDCLAANLS
ncbi:MAG: zinc ribbon domain-containing protein [Bifidobacterium sp.]|nr:zinc ribbon domain-containing protein [Bifidobacterium sp.]